MDKDTAKKIQEWLRDFRNSGGDKDRKEKIAICVLCFMDGYTSRILEKR